ncbi:alpha/beta hydrolase [Agromyces sp. LHK192]|uniref:alpha/beta hydrolase n=1 Tax=Agromyces sp. LHK192 TaxID=2498704 RepID=UPI00196A50B5|nr:alpha/beta hydrolase [Agromyces sp. LHK192]
MPPYHPDLAVARFIPKISFSRGSLRFLRRKLPTMPDVPGMRIENVSIPGGDGAPPVRVRVYDPVDRAADSPALLWLHGGGFLIGDPEQDEASSIGFARDLGALVVSVDYRLAPEHPSPAATADAYAALTWLFDQAAERGVDPARIAIGGASAGGGLAASLALYAHDRGVVRPAFQLLVYPMLDDRTVLRDDLDTRWVRGWTPKSNRFGWTSYLGGEPGASDVSAYAAPARRVDLTGLPPAWIGVGSLDLFRDEDRVYAERLREAGVPCEYVEIEGAFHGFDAILRKAGVSKSFWRMQADALRRALAAAVE